MVIRSWTWPGTQSTINHCGGKYSWIINLLVAGITASPVPDGVIASTSFEVVKHDKHGDRCHSLGTMDFELASPVLRHAHLLHSSPDPEYRQRLRFLLRQLHTLAIAKISQLEEFERPASLHNIVDEVPNGPNPPSLVG
jgi:hypothetical protein